MAAKRTIKRIVLGAIWTLITGGMVTLLVAANGKGQEHHCADVRIAVRGTGEQYYISKSDINFLLCANGEPTLKGRSLGSIDLARLERRLEGQSWIKEAELYFDRADVLHVTVRERQPVARVFATNGTSFYIDSSGAKLPLLSNITARVPVITGYSAALKPLPKDSAAMAGARSVVQFIGKDDFWSAQLAQIDITPVGSYELLPTVGNHTIRIGNADSLESKLGRLMLFYKQVASKAGFDKYSVLDVQYAGQVVAVHRGESAVVDSAALKRNIAALLRADQMMAAHTAAEAVTSKAAPAPDSTKATAAPTATAPKKAEKPKPVAGSKPLSEKEPAKKAAAEKIQKPAAGKKTTPAQKASEPPQKKPKAIMQKRQ